MSTFTLAVRTFLRIAIARISGPSSAGRRAGFCSGGIGAELAVVYLARCR